MNKELSDICEIRDYAPADHAFVMATMLRGLYYGDSWFSIIPKSLFMGAYKHIAEALVKSPKNATRVAVLKDAPDVILGYSILNREMNKIHFVFVKKDWRGKGLGRALIPENPLVVTHLTQTGKNLLPKFKNCVFNPFDL